MAVTKHRDAELFAAEVDFDKLVTMRADQVVLGSQTVSTQLPSSSGDSAGGAIDVSDVDEAELTFDRIRYVRTARITLTELAVAVTAANDFGGSKICDLPDSNILILGAEANLSLDKDGTGIVAATDLVVGIGTAVASNSTLSGAMIDVLTDALTDDVDPAIFAQHTNDLSTPALVFVDDGAAAGLFLNVAATLTVDGSVLATGTIDIYYIDTGNVTS